MLAESKTIKPIFFLIGFWFLRVFHFVPVDVFLQNCSPFSMLHESCLRIYQIPGMETVFGGTHFQDQDKK